jgi:hypothetical protein
MLTDETRIEREVLPSEKICVHPWLTERADFAPRPLGALRSGGSMALLFPLYALSSCLAASPGPLRLCAFPGSANASSKLRCRPED